MSRILRENQYTQHERDLSGFVLEYVLKENGFTVGEDVFVEYMTNPADIGALLSGGSASVAMLPQPYVATLTMKNEQIKVALDMTEEFNKASKDSKVELMTSCIAVKNSTYEENKNGVEQFLEEYKASVEYVNANPKESSTIIATLGIVAAAGVAEKAIPECNIVYIDGDEMKSNLNAFYSVCSLLARTFAAHFRQMISTLNKPRKSGKKGIRSNEKF